MAKAAHSEEFRAAFEKHHTETEGQVKRLEQVFELMEETAKGKKCEAIEGLIEEGKEGENSRIARVQCVSRY